MKRWLPEEIAVLKGMYPNHSLHEVLKALPERTKEAIKTRASRLHIRSSSHALKPIDFNLAEYQRGWIEALIDSEGCLGLGKQKTDYGRRFHWMPYLIIANTNKALLEHLKEILGPCCHIRLAKRQFEPKRKPIFVCQINRSGMRSLLSKITLIAKEKQRNLIMEALKLLLQHQSGYRPNDARLEAIYHELKLLNRRGVL